MACEFSVEYHASDGNAATQAALQALDRIEEIETQLTVYRDASEVIDINASAAAAPWPCEPGLFGLLELAERLAQETSGALDITSGPLSRVWGFFQRAGRLPADDELAAALARVDYRCVQLEAAAQTVKLLRPDVEINFNSLGKGYALDRAAELLAEAGLQDFLLQGGSSSVLARGVQRDCDEDGWMIGVPHPLAPDRLLGQVRLQNGALGTAGSGTQWFECDGKRYGHLIDPRTGWPAEGTYAATVVADQAAAADGLATALYVLGPGGAAEYCAAHPDVGAVLACPGAGEATVDVHVFNLTPRQWRPA